MPNRLAQSSSPYLRQHQDNPVDWYPWGDDAFARAAAEDKPIFLSIGYSSCHWCHVMAHESFEDDEVAEILNERFISVKVDREERPDVDEAYMAAVQLTSGRGGWPMSLFLTPDRRPFFAATYMPKVGHGENPGFIGICGQISEAWRGRRADVERIADQIAEALAHTLAQSAPKPTAAFDQAFLDRAAGAVLSDYDPEHGGFGPAPKFPPHTSIGFLLSYATETDGPVELREAAVEAALITLRQMALGGIHDQVGGGFHRYSTDNRWLLPHFEKMLTDNALMLGNLARASIIAQQVAPPLADHFRAVGAGIVDWLARDMTSPEGLFYSAIDADSEGEEGKFYVWEESEVKSLLGPRADAFLTAFGFEPGGNFLDEATGQRTGANIPHLAAEVGESFEEDLDRLLLHRNERVPPQTDEKAIVAGNGLMIGALAEVGMLPMAARAADAILAAESVHGRLPHQIVGGVPAGDAYLDGYAYLVDALLRVAVIAEAFAAEGEPIDLERTPTQYRAEAVRLAGEMIARFYDDADGGFFFSGERHEALFGRSKPVFDQPTPSPNAVALRVLIELGAVPRIFQTRDALLGWLEKAPQATGALHEALIAVLHETAELPSLVVPPPVREAVVSARVTGNPKAVSVELSTRELVADAEGYGRSEVRINIAPGHHLNSNEPPARWLTPTRIEVRPLESEIVYPPSENDRYEGDIWIPFRVRLPARESGAEFEVRVSYQVCTDTECLAPAERVFDCIVRR